MILPSAATCTRLGPYSSPIQKVPSFSRTSPSVSRPLGSNGSCLPSLSNAASVLAAFSGLLRPVMVLPAASFSGIHSVVTKVPSSFSLTLTIDGTKSGRGNSLALSSPAQACAVGMPVIFSEALQSMFGPRSVRA